jgi:hypothetical protein
VAALANAIIGADGDGDGHTDVVVLGGRDEQVLVFLGDGSGGFGPRIATCRGRATPPVG